MSMANMMVSDPVIVNLGFTHLLISIHVHLNTILPFRNIVLTLKHILDPSFNYTFFLLGVQYAYIEMLERNKEEKWKEVQKVQLHGR